MGYQHIENLYKCPEFRRCYALEKIHGMSAWIEGTPSPENRVSFHPGQPPYGKISVERFKALFPSDLIENIRTATVSYDGIRIFGELFGASVTKKHKIYGEELRFLAFDVQIDGRWLSVPQAEEFVRDLGLGFVPYEEGPLTIEWLESQRDRPSLVATVPDAIREGIVIRPIYEMIKANGERLIAKFKRDEFRETASPRPVREIDPAVLEEAEAVAKEWVTEERLQHVLQKVEVSTQQDTGVVVRAMLEDVKREAHGEVVWSNSVEKAISKETAALFLASLIIARREA